MIRSFRPLFIVAIATALFADTSAYAEDAQEPPPNEHADYVEVAGNMSGFSGARQLNIAAGDGNQQANLAMLASGDLSFNSATITQVGDREFPRADRTYDAKIASGAFANSHGLTAINIAAGSGNQQANITMITTGLEGQVASNALLSQTRASSEPLRVEGTSANSEFAARIESGAFSESSGIVQISLIGGAGNTSANVAVLSLEAGTN